MPTLDYIDREKKNASSKARRIQIDYPIVGVILTGDVTGSGLPVDGMITVETQVGCISKEELLNVINE